jgi:hypothetical protein
MGMGMGSGPLGGSPYSMGGDMSPGPLPGAPFPNYGQRGMGLGGSLGGSQIQPPFSTGGLGGGIRRPFGSSSGLNTG